MSNVVKYNVVSVYGYTADANDGVGPLFDWYSNGDTPITESFGKVSKISAEYTRPRWDSIGAMVCGRHLFDMTNGWDGTPPAGDHVIVVSHSHRFGRARPGGVS